MTKKKQTKVKNIVFGAVVGLAVAILGTGFVAVATDVFRVEGGLDAPTIGILDRLLNLAEQETVLGGDLAFGGTTSADWNVGGALNVTGEASFNSTTTIDLIQLEKQTATTTCGASVAGNIMFSADSQFYGCDGSNWIRLNN